VKRKFGSFELSMTSFLEGGCQCGAVRYKVAAEASSTNHCHCTMCRKTHGAMFATFAIIDRSKFSITKGEDGVSFPLLPCPQFVTSAQALQLPSIALVCDTRNQPHPDP